MADNNSFSSKSSPGINTGFKEKIIKAESLGDQNIEQPVLRPEKERAYEQLKESKIDAGSMEAKIGQTPSGGIMAASQVSQKMQARKKIIESILENGLENIYVNLSPAGQAEFKITGEKTAREINSLLEKTKVKVLKIVELIKKWLLLLPGVNKYFIEQEAKIKADEIIKIRDRK